MEEQEQPLITNNDHDAKATPETSGLFIWLLALSAGISGLLFGYDTGVVSATLVCIDAALSNRTLSSVDKSVITSVTSLFALLVSPVSSVLADCVGRRRVILATDLLFVAGALAQAASRTVWAMVAGRAIVGLAVGAASFVAPLYVAELAPATHRGRLVTLTVLLVTVGQVVAYLVGWIFSARVDGWRYMVGLGALPAAMQTCVVIFMPDTPRWLVKAGRSEEAAVVVARVLSGGAAKNPRAVGATLRIIEAEIKHEEEASRMRTRGTGSIGTCKDNWRRLFDVPRNKRALAIACLLQGLQQLCGFNSLMYFSATIFKLLGFTSPTLTSLVVANTNFVFTAAALVVIDRIGRRRILLWSIPFMVAALLFAAYGFTLMRPTSVVVPDSQGAALVVLFAIMTYVAAYALGLGNVPWMQSELFTLSARSLGSGLATATNWGANVIVGLTFLPFMDALGPSRIFVLYAAVCMAGYYLIWRLYPETTGLSLEEAAALLDGEGWRRQA